MVTGSVTKLGTDTVASSGGWSPVIHLAGHCGSRPVWNEEILGFLAGPTVEKRLTAGAANGEYTTAGAIAQGIEAAQTAIEALDKSVVDVVVPATEACAQDAAMTLFHVPHIKRTARAPKQFVDYQNDVTAAGIELLVVKVSSQSSTSNATQQWVLAQTKASWATLMVWRLRPKRLEKRSRRQDNDVPT